MGINGDPLVIKVDSSDPLPVTIEGAVTIDEPLEVEGTVAVSSIVAPVSIEGTVPVSIADPVTATTETEIDAGNSNTGTLGAGLTWTGSWKNLDGFVQIFYAVKSDQAGTYTMQFSLDGITTDRTIGPYSIAAGGSAVQPLAATREYFRVTFTNTSGSTANLRIETRLVGSSTPVFVRIEDDLSNASPAQVVRSVIAGVNDNGTTFTNAQVDESGNLHVEVRSPTTAFGELMVAKGAPRIQSDAIYGLLLGTDHEVFSASGGSATASNSLFNCTTGVSVGAYAVIRSRRLIRYRPGQGTRLRFTAAFTTGVALSEQGAGGFTATDGCFVGYSGATFGVTRRIAGACAIVRLTITVGAGGAENMTVTLNGVAAPVIASGGALSTTGTAERIAEVGTFAGWTSAVSPTSNGATVTFIQQTPAATAGAFTFASTGTAAGTFATVQAGAANDDVTGFVPQASWNVDPMDGTGPSGVTLDPTKLNVYEILIPYLGAGAIVWRVMAPVGHFITVHHSNYPNLYTTPNQKNPTYRMGWFAASLGSTTSLTVTGSSAAAFVDGELASARDPFSTSNLNFAAGVTEYVALALRVRGEFAGTTNQREISMETGICATETTARVVRVRWILNPTLTGTVDWGYVDQSLSAVERATPTNIAPTGGREVATDIVASGAASRLYFDRLDLRMEPGDVLVAALQTVSGSATCAITANWLER